MSEEQMIKIIKGKLFGPLARMCETKEGKLCQKIFLFSTDGVSRKIVQMFPNNNFCSDESFNKKVMSIFSNEDIDICYDYPQSIMEDGTTTLLWSEFILPGIDVDLLVFNNRKIIAFGNKEKWISAKSCNKIYDIEEFKKHYIKRLLKKTLTNFKLRYEALIPYIPFVPDSKLRGKIINVEQIFNSEFENLILSLK